MHKMVREFSVAGPCIPLGEFVKESEHFWYYRDGGIKRVKKGGRAHIEACPSCRDHAGSLYPHGYMD